MPKLTEYTNRNEDALILVEYEDGSSWSGLKSAYDEQQAAQAQPQG
jgi:hypothetical protein